MRSRAVRRPFLCWLSMALGPPPSRICSSSLRTAETRSAKNRMLASKRAAVASTRVVRMELEVSVGMNDCYVKPALGEAQILEGGKDCKLPGRIFSAQSRSESIACGDSARGNVSTDELDDVVHRCARLENGCDASLFHALDILIGNDSAQYHQHVVHFVVLQEFHHSRDDGVVRARKNGEPDYMDVLLQCCIHNHFGSLAQSCVNDLHAGISKSARNHLSAAVVAV